jgi:hypothetical protein
VQQSTQPTQPTQPTQAGTRPTGITVLAILAAIGGVFALLGGLALIGLGGLASASGVGGFAVIIGLLLLVLGVLQLVLAYGFWGLKPWAWTLGVGLQVASVVLSLLQFLNNTGGGITSLIISIVISGVILYYLFQPHVKAAFGRS